MRHNSHYEDAPEYGAGAYSVRQYPGIAFRVNGWETEPDEDTEWSGCENRTGMLDMTMIGDDRHFHIDPSDVMEIAPTDFCRECGQIGCGCAVWE